MLRQLLLVLALVFGVVFFSGCERDGVNGTTDRDGVTEQQDTLPAPTDNGTADEFGLDRGTRDTRDSTTTPSNGQTDDPNVMQQF